MKPQKAPILSTGSRPSCWPIGQVSLDRSGATIFRGESNSTLDQSSNLVTLSFTGAALSSGGGTENYATFRTTQYNAKNIAFYNLSFVNYALAMNYMAIAMDVKAEQVGFYSCGFYSCGFQLSQGTLLANYGSFYFADCCYGAAYFYNFDHRIIRHHISSHYFCRSDQSSYDNSQFVYDTCAFLPASSAVPATTSVATTLRPDAWLF